MQRGLAAGLVTARRWAAAPFDANPTLKAFYGVLATWTLLGVFTLFAGLLGLVVQVVCLVSLPVVALLACFDVARTLTAAAKFHTVTAFVVALAMVPACPNDAGPYVFFAVHGGRLDALARELSGAEEELYLEATPIGAEPASGVFADGFGPVRRRLRSAGVLGAHAGKGRAVFPVDGVADNVRGFAYFAPGTPLPTPGDDFEYGMLAQFAPMSRKGWYFFTTI